MDTPTWIKIGEHSSRDVLKEMARKIRAKWAGRYDFLICPLEKDKKGFELHLRHR